MIELDSGLNGQSREERLREVLNYINLRNRKNVPKQVDAIVKELKQEDSYENMELICDLFMYIVKNNFCNLQQIMSKMFKGYLKFATNIYDLKSIKDILYSLCMWFESNRYPFGFIFKFTISCGKWLEDKGDYTSAILFYKKALSECKPSNHVNISEGNTALENLFIVLRNKYGGDIKKILRGYENVFEQEGAIYVNDILLYVSPDTKGVFRIMEGCKCIAESSFEKCSEIEKIIIPESVVKIGSNAFFECLNLKSMTIPNSVKRIGREAFGFCKNLSSIQLSENLESISEGAFEECVSLKNITIPINVKSIEEAAFAGCSTLSEIIIPENVEMIDNYAFFMCSRLENVSVLNDNITICDDNFDSSVIDPSWYESLTIFGNEGSNAEKYAGDNCLVFKNLEY